MNGNQQVSSPYIHVHVFADSSLYTVTNSKAMTPHMTSFDEQLDSVKLHPSYNKSSFK